MSNNFANKKQNTYEDDSDENGYFNFDIDDEQLNDLVNDDNSDNEYQDIIPNTKPTDIYKNYIKNTLPKFNITNEQIENITSPQTYLTEINLDESIPIYVLSDIHADLQALIICLRDCARVIRKKSGMELPDLLDRDSTNIYLPEVSDPYLQGMLNIDICEQDNTYDDSLGYEWCGSNSIVVIIGDIIDGSRGSEYEFEEKSIYSLPTLIHDYPQLEIKLLRFINSINKMAMMIGGRIYKLLGNHEIINSLAIDFYKKQTFSRLSLDYNYFINRKTLQLENRFEAFQYGGSGYELVMEDGAGILLKINDYIFVHGSIQKVKFELVKKINNILNDRTVEFGTHLMILDRFSSKYIKHPNDQYRNLDNLLWDRTFGNRLEKQGQIDYINETTSCEEILNNLKYFMDTDDSDIISKIKIFIGHCIQSSYKYSISGLETFTLIDQAKSNLQIETLIGPAQEGEQNVHLNRIYGIGMGCSNNDHRDHMVYKVDIGSSRSQDQFLLDSNIMNQIENIYDEKNHLLGRSPQLLKILSGNINLIRSNMRNTRIYQPRPRYELYASTKPRPDSDRETINYLKKYLKYKNKYILLKNK